MKKTILALLVSLIAVPAFAEGQAEKVRMERPFSLGLSGGWVPFAGLYADYAISETNSIGINLTSTIIYNTVLGHYRTYFSDPETYNTDFYMESRLGLGQNNNLSYSPAKLSFNGAHYYGYEYRADWGFVFNSAMGLNLFVNSDLSGLIALSGEVALGYSF